MTVASKKIAEQQQNYLDFFHLPEFGCWIVLTGTHLLSEFHVQIISLTVLYVT